MAITWKRYIPNTNTVEKTWTTHVGLVISQPWVQEERVMSDVYANVSRVLVWNPQKLCAEAVVLGYHFECCTEFGTAVVDASPEIMSIWAQQKEEALRKEAELRRQALEADRLRRETALKNTPKHGKLMTVVRGRKVPQGTTGTVFFIRDGRVGLALDDQKNERGYFKHVIFVDASYLAAA